MAQRTSSGPPRRVTRRTLLEGATAAGVASAGALGYARLPAWARTLAHASALRKPGSRPFPQLPAGQPTPRLSKLEHVVVLVLEGHSFDNILGMAAHQVPGRRALDGFRFGRKGRPINWNPSRALPKPRGPRVYASAAASPCQADSVSPSWNASHLSFNHGANNGFVQAGTRQAMGYWDRRTLPFTYSLAQQFPLGERYFSSVLAPSYPNRRFLLCATASGLTASNQATYSVRARNGTIFDRLLHHHVSWREYVQPSGATLNASALIVPNFANSAACTDRISPISQFYADAARGRLPSVSLIDPNYLTSSEQSPQDLQAGERLVAAVVTALTHSPLWPKTVLFLTYDTPGGYYDHLPPPAAIKPDNIPPRQAYAGPGVTLAPGAYNRYGFRVPLVVVSPWAKRHYSSRVTQDHTSILAFIERKWNLEAMTFRDANAHAMLDYFDFRQPAFLKPPQLAGAPAMAHGLERCAAVGLKPPPGTPGA